MDNLMLRSGLLDAGRISLLGEWAHKKKEQY